MGLQKEILPFPVLISIKKELLVKHKERGKNGFSVLTEFGNAFLHRDIMGWYLENQFFPTQATTV